MPKISDEQLKNFFAAAWSDPCSQITSSLQVTSIMSSNRHAAFAETVVQYHPLKIHADGDFPKQMIEERRPSESSDILDYRKKTYKAVTKLPISKVLTSLSKIRRSPDWMIQFGNDSVPAAVREDESLENYLNRIPGFGSITDWIFGSLLKQNAIDPNAIIAVLPLDQVDSGSGEYYQPVPLIFNSDHVLEYNEQKQICILQSRKKVNYLLEGAVYGSGFRFYYIDDKELIIYDQAKDGYNKILEIKHNFGKMPAFKVKAEAYKQYDDLLINRSRLDAMVPFLDEAACEYSDYKGSKVQHLFPLFWYVQNKDCNSCSGLGKKTGTGGETTCTDCDGTGKIKFSPFAHMQVDAAKLGEQGIPNPPAGYVQRDTAILELQDKSVDKNNYKALAAINMQFLDQTPLTQSGDAKNVDREELQNFVYNFAEDLIYGADKTIYWMNEWRYFIIVPDKKQRAAMRPRIPVPQNFDLLPTSYLIEEIAKAKGKVNPLILAMMEEQLAEKKFYHQPELAKKVKLFFDLDPLPGITIDEKMTLIQNQAITKTDFVISTYMAEFITQALIDDPKFADKKRDEQKTVLEDMANEKISENDEAAQMIDAQKQKIIDEIKGAQPGGPAPAAAA